MDGSTSWQKLLDLKKSHLLQIAKYAVSIEVNNEPSFNWWVPHMLKKNDAIIALVKKHNAKYLKCMHKFGSECPKTIEDELDLYKCNDKTMWVDAFAKEMKNIHVAFDPLDDSMQPRNGYQFLKCHMIFDVKMEDFC